MPDGSAATPVSVRLPADMIETLDKVAAAIERSRSWVILDAIRQYLADEGAEILDVQEGMAEIERGEVYDADDVMARIREKIANATRAPE